MSRDFTPAGYRALLRALKDRGYRSVDYPEVDPAASHLVLRHDLDMSIEAALTLARLEQETGLQASYFVLLRGELYNPFSAASVAGLKELVALGHRVGLHLDASLYGDTPEALEAAAAHECALLETLLDRPVGCLTFHRPAQSLLGLDRPLAGRLHGYMPRFFSEIGYVSDSRGGWHHGHPLDHPAVAAGTALHLLTHPIWWTGPTPGDPVATLDAFLARRTETLKDHLAANCEPYRGARNGWR